MLELDEPVHDEQPCNFDDRSWYNGAIPTADSFATHFTT
jgi:hypothetical protein